MESCTGTDCQTIESLKAPPQSNKVHVPPSPTSRTRVMISERRDRSAGPAAEEDILPDIRRCRENDVLRRVPGPGARSGDGVAPNASGGFPRSIGARGADWGEYQMRVVSRRPSTDRLSNGRPRGARRPRSVIRQADAFWRVRWPFAEQTGLAGRARSTSGREAICRQGRAAGRPGPGIGRARAVLGRTGLAGRASLVTSSTSWREAVCRRWAAPPGSVRCRDS